MQSVRTCCWNVLGLHMALGAGSDLSPPAHLRPGWYRGGQHAGKGTRPWPRLGQRSWQKLTWSLAAVRSICVRHRQTGVLKKRWWGWAWQNGWAALGRTTRRVVLKRLSTESKRVRHWLQWASHRSSAGTSRRLSPVRAARPQHARGAPSWRRPHHAGWDSLWWWLHG